MNADELRAIQVLRYERSSAYGRMTMTCRLALCCTLVVCSAAVPGAQVKPVLSDQEILIQLERDWHGAFLRRDVATIASLLADDVVFTYADGARGDKTKELARVAEFNQQVDSSVQEDFIVKIHRDSAVVWFTQRMVGPVQGKPTEIAYRYMDVWVMRDGSWQCIASQSTKLTAPQG